MDGQTAVGAAMFTVVGAYTGMVYLAGADLDRAADYAHGNGFADWRSATHHLLSLGVGDSWQSHGLHRGIKITRTA
jgi:hypothetical protein